MLEKLRNADREEAVMRLLVMVVAITILALLISSLVTFGGFFLDRVNNPLVTYYGEVMQRSTLFEQADHILYCQQLSSFSLDANFACFDSQQELDAFAASR